MVLFHQPGMNFHSPYKILVVLQFSCPCSKRSDRLTDEIGSSLNRRGCTRQNRKKYHVMSCHPFSPRKCEKSQFKIQAIQAFKLYAGHTVGDLKTSMFSSTLD
jgi:hypothetical protein